jgi:hypothetical protein
MEKTEYVWNTGIITDKGKNERKKIKLKMYTAQFQCSV